MDTLKEGNFLEDYFFDTYTDEVKESKVYVLIIYDIVDDRKRNRLAKFLQGYGFRIQKSAFEAMLTIKLYNQLQKEIGKFATDEDSIRVYRIIGKGQVTCYGMQDVAEENEVIII